MAALLGLATQLLVLKDMSITIPSSVVSSIPEFVAGQFSEKIVSLHVDLWKKDPQIPRTYTNEGLRSILSERLYNFLINDPFVAIGTLGRPTYFNINVEMSLLDLVSCGSVQSYFDSQILFIIAKHCFLRQRGVYDKIKLISDFNDFYVFVSSLSYVTQSTTWFNSYITQRMMYANQLDSLINNHYERICTILSTYDSFDEVADIYLFLSSKNNNVDSLNYIYALSLGSDPFNSDDEELVFKAEEIINDPQFSSKMMSSYGVLNGLKRVTGIKTTSFYNFYTSDESTSGEGDSVVNSLNYYDAAASFKYMPRYIKLTWNPIQGGSGIDTIIVPISGNISNVSEVQVLNEYYFSQTFRKDSNVVSSAAPVISAMSTLSPSPGATFSTSTAPTFTSAAAGGTITTSTSLSVSSVIAMPPISAMPRDVYITICSSSMNKFVNSSFWNKIIYEFDRRETKDIIDNMIFVVDHNLLRKRSEEPPRLQYVGYLIHKYEWYDSKWKLKEIIMLDDCRSSYYYDFNILYNKRYKYKVSSLIKWIYSTSLVEVESFYNAATFINESAISMMPETKISLPSTEKSLTSLDSISMEGLSIIGSAEQFEGRAEKIAGEITREDESIRTETADSSLESTVSSVSMFLSEILNRERI